MRLDYTDAATEAQGRARSSETLNEMEPTRTEEPWSETPVCDQ